MLIVVRGSLPCRWLPDRVPLGRGLQDGSCEMSETQQTSQQTPPTVDRLQVTHSAAPRRTGWTGWVIFAGVMMIMLGIFQIVEGLTALFRHTYYVVPSSNLLVHVSYTSWGWTQLGIGAVAVLTGLGLMAGLMWARILGVVLALASATVNLAFVAA